jgi:hypothetical protein
MNILRGSIFAGCLLVTIPSIADQTISLIEGNSFAGWMTAKGGAVPAGWEIVDGAIHLDASRGSGGNIVTVQEYGDFILDFEWKIASAGNSGIKYRVREFGSRMLGCEYQIIDDDLHHDGQSGRTSTGSLYHLYPPGPAKYLNPVGEYNQSRIVVCGQRLEHWLNGQLIVSADVGSPQWWAKKEESKFAETDGFGENRYGRIMLTDHQSDVWYRNLRLTPLLGCWQPADAATPYFAEPCPRPRRRLFRIFRRRL